MPSPSRPWSPWGRRPLQHRPRRPRHGQPLARGGAQACGGGRTTGSVAAEACGSTDASASSCPGRTGWEERHRGNCCRARAMDMMAAVRRRRPAATIGPPSPRRARPDSPGKAGRRRCRETVRDRRRAPLSWRRSTGMTRSRDTAFWRPPTARATCSAMCRQCRGRGGTHCPKARSSPARWWRGGTDRRSSGSTPSIPLPQPPARRRAAGRGSERQALRQARGRLPPSAGSWRP